jgi:hypothetical protein
LFAVARLSSVRRKARCCATTSGIEDAHLAAQHGENDFRERGPADGRRYRQQAGPVSGGARPPPVSVEAGKPNRTDRQFAANPVSISTQFIYEAGLVNYPG